MGVSSLREMWKNRRNREAIYSTSQYWDAKAVEQQGDAVSMWPNNNLNAYYHHELLAMLERLLPDVNSLHVLDIGCGTGRNSRYFADRGALVLGIDFSEKAIGIARRKSSAGNPTYRVLSVFDLEDRDAFDAAVSWGTVAIACRNRAELADVLSRIARSLKPGGKLLLCEPIHKGFLHRVLDMDIREFCAVLEETGFNIEKVLNLHFWPMRLALAYVRLPNLLTRSAYCLGQGIMTLFGNKLFGDYKVVYAFANK